MDWDLSLFFGDKIGEFIDGLSSQIDEFNGEFKGRLQDLSPNDFSLAIARYDELCSKVSKVMSYAHLSFAKDTSKGAFLAKYEDICAKLEEKLLFFELEFNEMATELQDSFISVATSYSYYLKNLQKHKAHQLSLAEERVLLRTANTGASAFSRLFDESFARMRFSFRGEELSEEAILAKLSDSDRSVRKDAAKALSEGLKPHQHLLAFIFNMIKTDLKNSCELRGFSSPESSRHLSNQIDKSSVDALIVATESSFEISHEYYAKKREILGLDELYDYDRYAPLGGDQKCSFDEAQKTVLEAFSAFSPRFGELAQKAFDEGWCDAFASPLKQSGAFSHSASADTHPFVLLNHTDRRRDLFTLAHELGHAIHQYLSYSVGYLNSHTPLVTAETASVFCEMLVFDYIKARTDKSELRALLASKIEDIFATLFRQINFTTFERRIHAFEGEISLDELNEIWMEESKKMFGKELILSSDYAIWWSYIPHFIHSPFYCYAYSYAQLLVLALYGLYKSGRCADFVEIYTGFLSSGGSESPADLIRRFGFDLDDERFWQIGLDEVRALVSEFKAL